MTRYPLEELAARLGIPLGQIGGYQPGQMPSGLAAIAEWLNVSHRTAQRLHQNGLSADQADRCAAHAGYHPAEIWPEWLQHSRHLLLVGAAHTNALKNTCPQGHPYDTTSRGERRCLTCHRATVARWRLTSQRVHPSQEAHMGDDPLLTRKQLARRWQISERTIERMVNDGRLTPVRIGRLIRFRLEHIEHIEQAEQTA